LKNLIAVFIATVIALLSTNIQAQDLSDNTVIYTQTIQPIKINQSNSEENTLKAAYNDFIGKCFDDGRILYKRKVEMREWEPRTNSFSKETRNSFIATLIFPQGVFTLKKNGKISLTLHEHFDSWATGEHFCLLAFGNVASYYITEEYEY